MKFKTNQKGFTLIELLVVIVVIGILVALTLPNLFAAQERARDSERKNDLRNISQQLETYYNDNNEYPSGIYGGELDGYMDEVPTDPQGDAQYGYTTVGDPPAQYTLTATLENENDDDNTVESINRASSP